MAFLLVNSLFANVSAVFIGWKELLVITFTWSGALIPKVPVEALWTGCCDEFSKVVWVSAGGLCCLNA